MSISFMAALSLGLLLAQLPAEVSSEAPEGITVVKASWQKVAYRPGWDEPHDSATNVGLQDVRTNTSRDANGNPTGNTPLPSTGFPAIRPSERLEQRKNPRATADNEIANDGGTPGQRVEQYVYQVKVLNSGSKTIEAIDWEYSFSTAEGQSSPHRFQTFRRIRAASSSTLTARSSAPPSRVISARSGAKTALVSRVIVRCILYSDGTARWRDGADDRECDVIKSQATAR